MTDRKFNTGDNIRHKPNGYVGTVVSGDDANGYSVRYPCDDEEYHMSKDDIEFVDAKSVFLARLKSLLREFDAEIVWTVFAIDARLRPRIDIELGKERISFDGVENLHITASNIMDFEKE